MDGARNPANDLSYSEYFRRVVLLAALDEFKFLLTNSNVLTDAISDCRAAFRAMSGSHPVPDCEYIGFRHLRGRNAGGAVDYFVIAPDETWQYVDVTVSVFVRHVYV